MSGIAAYSSMTSSAVSYDTTGTASKDAAQLGKEKAEAMASINLTLSPEAVARIREESANQTPLSKEEIDKNIAAMQPLRADALSIQNSRTPALDHPLYSDPSIPTTLTDFQSFFALAADGSNTATSALADALYDAVSSPLQGWTDTTQGMDIALMQAKLQFINRNYVPQEHQAQVDADIDSYIGRRLEERNSMLQSSLEGELSLAQSLGDTARTTNAQAAITAFTQGNHRIQTETAQIFSITAGSSDQSKIADNLSQWYAQLASTLKAQNQQAETLIASWQQFVQKYAA